MNWRLHHAPALRGFINLNGAHTADYSMTVHPPLAPLHSTAVCWLHIWFILIFISLRLDALIRPADDDIDSYWLLFYWPLGLYRRISSRIECQRHRLEGVGGFFSCWLDVESRETRIRFRTVRLCRGLFLTFTWRVLLFSPHNDDDVSWVDMMTHHFGATFVIVIPRIVSRAVLFHMIIHDVVGRPIWVIIV